MIDREIALDHMNDLAEQIRDIAGQLYASDKSVHIRSIVHHSELVRYHVWQQMGKKCK